MHTGIQMFDGERISLHTVHTLIVGSGAAGLNAAVRLHAEGVEDLLILTEGLDKGTSIKTGRDKQTYYKLGMCGGEDDSPAALAGSLFSGGRMHGDLAMVEAALSARAFMNLVNLGVPFPRDRYGQFAGYKTDHDPRQRATSSGPYCSRDMCRALIAEVRRREIPVLEDRLAVKLLVWDQEGTRRAGGILALNYEKEGSDSPRFEAYRAENVVLAAGGPGGLYASSVYPQVHTGAIGIALMEGAIARNLPQSQFGLASIAFRWNVSGTYMQVIPRVISTNRDGTDEEREFLRPWFGSAGEMNSMVFLKGYQWPFDANRIRNGSSIIDILVYIETVRKKRRVFLDYRTNPAEFDFASLSREAQTYLENSQALFGTPIDRLRTMNPKAIRLYADHGIDITSRPLEIAVCAQHNNGGLAANGWWESENIRHFFAVGEINGSHGISRPGGSALNSGQTGGFRCAEYIAHRYAGRTGEEQRFIDSTREGLACIHQWLAACNKAPRSWQEEQREFKERMSACAAHIRSPERIKNAVDAAWGQWKRVRKKGCRFDWPETVVQALQTRYLCCTHVIYLEAIKFSISNGEGSCGSTMLLDPRGEISHPDLGAEWNFVPENPSLRNKVLQTRFHPDGTVQSRWVVCRPLPKTDAWFETAWAEFREGRIYE